MPPFESEQQPVLEVTDDRMMELAGEVDELIEDKFGTGLHFSLMIWRSQGKDGTDVNYISSVPHEAAEAAMTELIARWQKRKGVVPS